MTIKELFARLDVISVLGFLIAIETQITNGSMSFAHTLPEVWIPVVKEWAANLASAGGLLVGILRLSGNSAAASAIVKTLIIGVALSFLMAGSAHAQVKSLGQIQSDINAKLRTLDQLNQQIDAKAKAAVTPTDATAALPCMDISVLTKLTPQNLVPTLKGCEQDGVNKLVVDTQRALDSAKAFTGSATGTTAAGDNDAINCLSPGLALFKAAAIISAVPDTPAVLNADGTVKTPAITGTPEIDPGPILLFQKYREFTIVGGLTSCQTWINGPVNATAAAGIAGAGSVIAGAALLAPKP